MKKWSLKISIFLAAANIVAVQPIATVYAYDAKYLSDNEIVWYTPGATNCSASADLSSVSPGAGAPNGLTYPNLDATKMADAIEKFIDKHASSSPMKGTTKYAVASAKKANINPFLAYAHSLKESGLGTTTISGAQVKIHQGHNTFGRTASSSQPSVPEGTVAGKPANWYMWPTFQASVDYSDSSNTPDNTDDNRDDWYEYDRDVFSTELNKGITAYISRYAPPSENDTTAYIKQMQGYLDEMAMYAGADLSSGASTTTNSSTVSAATNSACCASSGASTNGGTKITETGDHVKTAVGYLTSSAIGLTLPQAAGVIGNLQQESGESLNPKASNGSHTGIAQWDNADRYDKLKKFAHAIGGDPTTYTVQLRYLTWELGFNNEWKDPPVDQRYANVGTELKATKNYADAARLMEAKYEISGGSATDKRIANAKAVYEKYMDQGVVANTSIDDASAAACSSTGSGDVAALQDYLIKYAWPDYRKASTPGALSKKPDYGAAVSKAMSEGKYVGVTTSGREGLDCGGFITLLLLNSGWDKNYNYGGVIKDGAGPTGAQEPWAAKNWQLIGTGATLKESDLQPGDVAFVPGHTWMYTGMKSAGKGGFQGDYASASNSERSPMSSNGPLADNRFSPSQTKWYRKKGVEI